MTCVWAAAEDQGSRSASEEPAGTPTARRPFGHSGAAQGEPRARTTSRTHGAARRGRPRHVHFALAFWFFFFLSFFLRSLAERLPSDPIMRFRSAERRLRARRRDRARPGIDSRMRAAPRRGWTRHVEIDGSLSGNERGDSGPPVLASLNSLSCESCTLPSNFVINTALSSKMLSSKK